MITFSGYVGNDARNSCLEDGSVPEFFVIYVIYVCVCVLGVGVGVGVGCGGVGVWGINTYLLSTSWKNEKHINGFW